MAEISMRAEISTRALAEMIRDAASEAPGTFADRVHAVLNAFLKDKPSEKPQSCPFCHGNDFPPEFDPCRGIQNAPCIGGNVYHLVCGARGPFKPTEAEAIAAWNSITLKAKESL